MKAVAAAASDGPSAPARPLPPPGRRIDRTLYRRGPEKRRLRRQILEDLP